MRQQMGFLEKVSELTDLGTEAIPKMPLIEIVGKNRALIENHRGVTEYGDCQIQVHVSFGTICIQGNQLKLARIAKEQLIITGTIDNIQLFDGRA